MEHYKILARGIARPEVLGVLFEAFDGAWAELEPEVGADPIARAHAQEKLARVILSFNENRIVEREWIKDAALAIMRKET